jgi:hypothetical protein
VSAPYATSALGQPVPIPRTVDPDVWRRFVRKVAIVPGGCHLWTDRPRDDGYGQFYTVRSALPAEQPTAPVLPGAEQLDQDQAADDRPRVWRAHRFAWTVLVGPLAEDQHLMHQCDEPLCVPVTVEALAAHIALGDNAANVADREHKQRGTRRGRHGLMFWGRSDRRGQAARSLALHDALRDALAAGAGPDDLPAVVAEVYAAGASIEQPLPGLE